MEAKETLKYIQDKFQVDLSQKLPIRLSINRQRGLTTLFSELGFKVGAEVGVEEGNYAKWLCIKMHKNKLKLFLIDPYIAYNEYTTYHSKEDQVFLDNAYKKAKEKLIRFNVEFIKKTSMEAVKDFKDNSLDFVFIDGNHDFQFVINDIVEWSKKVRPGGIISGHDYSSYMREVRGAVDAWVKIKRINPWFIVGEGTSNFCWFWVKK